MRESEKERECVCSRVRKTVRAKETKKEGVREEREQKRICIFCPNIDFVKITKTLFLWE